MDNTLSNNGRIDQKNIKFPTNILNCSFDPSTHNGGLIQSSAQTGLNIRNNPAQHLVRESNKAQGKNPTISVGCRFNSISRLQITDLKIAESLNFPIFQSSNRLGAYAPQVLPDYTQN